jgi:hypothetical protein
VDRDVVDVDRLEFSFVLGHGFAPVRARGQKRGTTHASPAADTQGSLDLGRLAGTPSGYSGSEGVTRPRRSDAMHSHHTTAVTDHDVEAVETRDVRVTETESRFSPAQVVHAAIGVFLVVLGIISLVRGGFEGDLTDPTFELIGITHNTAIGLGELVLGALLLLSAASAYGRFLGLVVGLAMVAFGAVIVADDGFAEDVATEQALGWLAIALGAAAVLFGLIPARRVRRRSADRATVVDQ